MVFRKGLWGKLGVNFLRWWADCGVLVAEGRGEAGGGVFLFLSVPPRELLCTLSDTRDSPPVAVLCKLCFAVLPPERKARHDADSSRDNISWNLSTHTEMSRTPR